MGGMWLWMCQAGMTLRDRQCEPFYERLLREETRASIIRTVERCDRLTANELEERLATGGGGQAAETSQWLESSLKFLEEKLYALADSLDLQDRDAVIQRVIAGIRGRSLTVRPMLGCSLLTNAALRQQHPELLQHTGIRGLLAILVGAANDVPLRLAKEVLAAIDQELASLRALKASVGKQLSDEAKTIIRRWARSKDCLTLWKEPGSQLKQGIMQRVQVRGGLSWCG